MSSDADEHIILNARDEAQQFMAEADLDVAGYVRRKQSERREQVVRQLYGANWRVAFLVSRGKIDSALLIIALLAATAGMVSFITSLIGLVSR